MRVLPELFHLDYRGLTVIGMCYFETSWNCTCNYITCLLQSSQDALSLKACETLATTSNITSKYVKDKFHRRLIISSYYIASNTVGRCLAVLVKVFKQSAQASVHPTVHLFVLSFIHSRVRRYQYNIIFQPQEIFRSLINGS